MEGAQVVKTFSKGGNKKQNKKKPYISKFFGTINAAVQLEHRVNT